MRRHGQVDLIKLQPTCSGGARDVDLASLPPVAEANDVDGKVEKPVFDVFFPRHPNTQFDPEGLIALANTMTGTRPLDHPDSGIPAGFTYFGQFVDHDITHDLMGDRNPVGSASVGHQYNPHATPALDLHSVYGENLRQLVDGKFRTQKVIGGEFEDHYRRHNGEAVIADPRNEDNLIVSSIHLLFMLFHNALMDHTSSNGGDKVKRVHEQVIKHYQWIVWHEFLPKIINKALLDDLSRSYHRYFYLPDKRGRLYMPLEFSGAAFRYGHAQVRDVYIWNQIENEGRERKILTPALLESTGLVSLPERGVGLNKIWVMDWRRFFNNVGEVSRPVNMARKINTCLSSALSDLPHSGGGALAQRTLIRGMKEYGLPSAQQLAGDARGGFPYLLSPSQICEAAGKDRSQLMDRYGFHRNTPLWFYVLLEAEYQGNDKLGPLGSQIIGEVMIGLLRRSPLSIFQPEWYGEGSPFESKIQAGVFSISDIIKFVADTYPKAILISDQGV